MFYKKCPEIKQTAFKHSKKMGNTTEFSWDLKKLPSLWGKLNPDQKELLVRTAPREALSIIISQEYNQRVLESILENNKVTSAEIIRIIERARSSRILEKISKISRWFTNHTIKRRLLENPHTPIKVSFRILDYLPLPEVTKIMQNPNISREVRNRARARLRTLMNRLSTGELKGIFLNSEGDIIKKLPVLTGKDKKVIMDILNSGRVPRRFIINLIRASATTGDIIQVISNNRTWMRDKLIRNAILTSTKVSQSTKNRLKNL